jgi:hypothetical protein
MFGSLDTNAITALCTTHYLSPARDVVVTFRPGGLSPPVHASLSFGESLDVIIGVPKCYKRLLFLLCMHDKRDAMILGLCYQEFLLLLQNVSVMLDKLGTYIRCVALIFCKRSHDLLQSCVATNGDLLHVWFFFATLVCSKIYNICLSTLRKFLHFSHKQWGQTMLFFMRCGNGRGPLR